MQFGILTIVDPLNQSLLHGKNSHELSDHYMTLHVLNVLNHPKGSNFIGWVFYYFQ